MDELEPLVGPEEQPHLSAKLFISLQNFKLCKITEFDRTKQKRKNLPPDGSLGLVCIHCQNHRFFPHDEDFMSNLENFYRFTTHLVDGCRPCPDKIRHELRTYKKGCGPRGQGLVLRKIYNEKIKHTGLLTTTMARWMLA